MGGLLRLVQRGGAWADCGPQSPPRCTKCDSTPINGQCTNFILFDVELLVLLHSEGLTWIQRQYTDDNSVAVITFIIFVIFFVNRL